jgi:adenylate cyclase class 2
MGYEVEVKYRLADHDQLTRRLVERGAEAKPALAHEDIYLSHPARDFALTREALRIRRIGEENQVTYKGPRHAGPTKTREEIEIGVSPGAGPFAEMLRLLEILGFGPVATIRKMRTPFHLTRRGLEIAVVMDRADGLGDFAEIETLVATESELPAAQAAVLALADELGLTEVEPRSYLRMALEARGAVAPASDGEAPDGARPDADLARVASSQTG